MLQDAATKTKTRRHKQTLLTVATAGAFLFAQTAAGQVATGRVHSVGPASAAGQAYLKSTPGSQGAGDSLDIFGPGVLGADSHGNVYVAAAGGVFRIDTSGSRTRVAGTGGDWRYSGDGGPAVHAGLDPRGVALDGDGNLYIADEGNNRIRKLEVSTGVLTSVAGNGDRGFSGDGGPAPVARLDGPTSVAVDGSGNLFIADGTKDGHSRVRRVDARTGIISTVAGNGSAGYSGDGGLGTRASFNSLGGLAVDRVGNLYLADSFNNRVRMVSAATGTITTVAGNGGTGASGDGALAINAELNNPVAIAVDFGGNLYIADAGNHRVREVTASTGQIATLAAAGNIVYQEAGSTNGRNSVPYAVSVDAAGSLYIGESGTSRIRVIPAGTATWVVETAPDASSTSDSSATASGFVINATYGASVPAAAQAAFNSLIATYESVFANTNATVNINVNFGFTGLGESSTTLIGVTYSSWRSAMIANASAHPANTYAAAATNSLPASDPIGGGFIYLTTANARALGFTANTSVDSTLTFSNSVAFEYNGVPVANEYDFLVVAAHELDEALCIGSALTGLVNNAPIPTNFYFAEDYFRYGGPGVRAITTSPTAVVYFSYDGGNTNVAQFDQAYSAQGASDLDRNDWIYGNFGCPAANPHVQNAIFCSGQAVPVGSPPETTVLSSLGYNPGNVVGPVAPSVFIDVPTANATLSGTVAISGWAIENTSSVGPYAVSLVSVLVDGNQVGTANYGVARPDVCVAFPGRPGCPNVGWNYNLNVASLAAGSHTLKIVATDTAGNSSFSQVSFTSTSLIQPSVFIDAPTAGATLAGTVPINGWAIENTSTVGPYAVSSVIVLVDGIQVGTASYGSARPDVCAAFPGRLGCPNVGWTYSLNVAALAAGVHSLKIVATDTAGNSSFSQVSFTAAAQVQPSVFIDAPTANAILAGTVTISGWAIENTTVVGPYAVNLVTVFVDGSQVATATYGVARPDVCAAFPGRLGCPNVGWSYNLNVAAFGSGGHTLKIVATDTAGNSSSSQVSFNVGAQPSVFIDVPTLNQKLSGTTVISGWAIENISAVGPYAVSSVSVFVDGSQVGTATYGVARPDVCAAFPGRLGCPNVGWTYSLNVSALASGSHTLQIVATDTAGNSAFGQTTFLN